MQNASGANVLLNFVLTQEVDGATADTESKGLCLGFEIQVHMLTLDATTAVFRSGHAVKYNGRHW